MISWALMARVIIIDDNETMREGLGATIRRMGHEAVLAASGQAGLAAFAKHGADFVVTDLKMEGTGGLDVLRAADSATSASPKYGLTGTVVICGKHDGSPGGWQRAGRRA